MSYFETILNKAQVFINSADKIPMKDKTLIQGYRYKDREQRLSALKNNQDFQNLSEETLKSLILAEPLLILSLKAPSKELILASLELESDVMMDLDKNLIDDEILQTALKTDLRVGQHSSRSRPSISWTMTRFLKTLQSVSLETQTILLSFDLRDSEVIDLLSEDNKLNFITSHFIRFKLIQKFNYTMAKLAVQKDYNNLEHCLESNQLTEVEKLELALFALKKQPLAIRFLTMVKSVEPTKAQIELEGKIEILKLMGAS